MENIFTFHKTVRGYSHVTRDIPCEDSSLSYADENGDFQIAVVCDGHGDPACLRSAYGSKALSEIATDCLKEYALGVLSDEEYKKSNREELLLEKSQNILVRRLTDIIISKWYDRIFADLKEHPLTEEDIASSGRYQPYYEKGERLEHVYGTTLIAALHMDDLLLLLQQGDGRCDVFFEDGTVEQPIPWDDRCFENVTTSMCDEDVTSSIRHQVLDLKKRPVIACYMGSDGVEDSYIDMEGTHSFYRALSVKIAREGTEGLEEYLEGYLPEFSQRGSGDDVSVAGIVSITSLAAYADHMEKQNLIYNVESSYKIYSSKLMSMEQKHQFLKKKMEDLGKKTENARARYRELEEKRADTQKRLDEIQNNIDKEEQELNGAPNEKELGLDSINLDTIKFGSRELMEGLQESFQKVLGTFRDKHQDNLSQLQNRQKSGRSFMKKVLEGLQGAQTDVDAAIAAYERARAEFEEYDARYQSVLAEVRRLEKEKEKLEDESTKEVLTKVEPVAVDAPEVSEKVAEPVKEPVTREKVEATVRQVMRDMTQKEGTIPIEDGDAPLPETDNTPVEKTVDNCENTENGSTEQE